MNTRIQKMSEKFNKMSDDELRVFSHTAAELMGDQAQSCLWIANESCDEEPRQALDYFREATQYLYGQIMFMQFVMYLDHCNARITLYAA